MKKLVFTFALLIVAYSAFSQKWIGLLPKDKVDKNTLNFFDIQKAFYDYWEPFNVDNGKYKNANGEMVKAIGWKQFKRWEWYWETRVDPQTGEFPNTSAWEEYQKYIKTHPAVTESNSGTWTNLGPSSSPGGYAGLGRVNCIGFHPTNSSIIYAGAATGGFWKTTNGGSSWTVTSDQNACLGVSDICVSTTDPNIIYIASGDREGTMGSLNGGQSRDNYSVGVLKSTDGGNTWNTTGLSWTTSQGRTIYRLIMDPVNNDILYAGTTNGLYKTSNAGISWTQVSLNIFNDLEFKPGTPSILYGANRVGDIFKSTDSGLSWTEKLNTPYARTELAVSSNDANVVYAVMANSAQISPVYKSIDGGDNFAIVFNSATKSLFGYDCDGADVANTQANYDLAIASDPGNVNTVYIGAVNTWKSTDGGITWNINTHWYSTCSGAATEVHADQHYLTYQPGTNYLFLGNDGGLYKTANDGTSWSYIGSGQVITQIYRIGVGQSVEDEIIIGSQDNGTKSYLSGLWADTYGGDGMECLIDYSDPNIMYCTYVSGDLKRSTDAGYSWTDISSSSAGLTGTGSWVTPYVIDPVTPTTLYMAYAEVYKTINRGDNWNAISNFGTGTKLRSLAVAPSDPAYIYAGANTIIYKTSNGGTSWSNITGTLPVGSGSITYICVKNDDPNTLWVSFGNYNSTRVFQSVNGGSTWTDISAGLPNIPVMCVVQNKQSTTRVDLYAATDLGIYVKPGTGNWQLFSTGLPNVLSTELDFYYASNADNSRIYAGTYGRGAWKSDLYTVGLPPVVNFSVNNSNPQTTSTSVTFSDLSSYSPNAWSWSFSPNTVTFTGGTTSSSQNPEVQFNSTGLYAVTLTSTNANGSNNTTKTSYIHVGQNGKWTGATSTDWNTVSNWENYQVPLASHDILISGASNAPVWTGNMTIGTDCNSISMSDGTQLTVTGDLNIMIGKTLTTTGLTTIKIGGNWNNYGTFTKSNGIVEFNGSSSTSVNRSIQATGGGKVEFTDASITGGGYYNIFTCTIPFTLVSAKVYASGGANRTFYWANSSGQIQQQSTVYVPDGESRVTLNFSIPAGTNLLLGVSGTANLFRNNAGGLSYPYAIGEVAQITSTSGGTSFYYYYYDIEYRVDFGSESFKDVIISKNQVETALNCSVGITGNLTLNSNAWLTNNSGYTLSVTGNTLFKADASGISSFIDNGTSVFNGTLTFERYVPANTVAYVSPPVSGATRNVFAGAVNNKLFQYNAVTGAWEQLTIDATPLEIMRGYVARYAANTTLSFTGTLNTAAQSAGTANHVTLTNGGSWGWNLVGNPYGSAIDIQGSGWTFGTDIQGFVSYRKTDGNVAYFTKLGGTGNNGGTQYIPPTQAYWINLDGASSIGLGTTNASRVHHSQNVYKTTADQQLFRITAIYKGHTDEATIGFYPDALNTHEAYDAEKMFINDTNFAMVYSLSDDQKNLAINGMSPLSGNRDVALGFEALKSGQYRFEANLSDLDPFVAVYLEDTQTGVNQDLRANSDYTFTSAPVNTTSRFILHFQPAKISGQVVYDNSTIPSLPLTGVQVILKDAAGTDLATTLTDANGNFSFDAVPADARLSLSFSETGGGWNAADAMLSMQHYTGMITLDSLSRKASDVNGSGFINSVDALMIMRRFVNMIQSFPAGEWVFEEKNISLSVPGATETLIIKGQCTGDVNKSFEP